MKLTKDQQYAVLRVAMRMEREYRGVRRMVQPTIGCDGAVVIRFAGMWLAIERDGYTHS